MSREQAIQFMQKTGENEKLRQELETLLGVGDGDISSMDELDAEEAQALKGDRGSWVIQLAGENGFEFSLEELMTVVDAFEKRQSGELSSEEFAQITGLTDFTGTSSGVFSWIEKTIQFFAGDRGDRNRPKPKPPTGVTGKVMEFMQKTASDEALKQELESLLGVGDGDISCHYELDTQEAQALKSDRGELVVKLAEIHGFEFSEPESIAVVEAFENRQSKELDRQSLMMQFLG